MDKIKAEKIFNILKKQNFFSYSISELVNYGKSAAVFKVYDSDKSLYALKIFDEELIERFGHEIQQKRIEQEISLINHEIKGLVKIIEGGKTTIKGQEYYYILMEYIQGQNLKQYIFSKSYESHFIKKVVKILYEVSEKLLLKGIAHRDIKPENIMIDQNGDVILMDLGVLKFIGENSFSDQDEKQFVGTLRYAPPEFLTRTEEDSILGWRAVNLYQIGAVMHDLITKNELFMEYVPYPNLVIAIKETLPIISNNQLEYEINQIARDLLIKSWQKRLSLFENQRLENFLNRNNNFQSTIELEINKLIEFTDNLKTKSMELDNIKIIKQGNREKRIKLSNEIESFIDNCFKIIKNKFPNSIESKFSIQKSAMFLFDSDKLDQENLTTKNFFYKIDGGLINGFPKPMLLLIKSRSYDEGLTRINVSGLFLGNEIRMNLEHPKTMFTEILRNKWNLDRNEEFKITSNEIFYGYLGFDQSSQDIITTEILKYINLGIRKVSYLAKEEFLNREKRINGEIINYERKKINTIFFRNDA